MVTLKSVENGVVTDWWMNLVHYVGADSNDASYRSAVKKFNGTFSNDENGFYQIRFKKESDAVYFLMMML